MGARVTDHLDAVVTDYLGRLDRAASSLPPERRVELVGEIAEHIAQARTTASAQGEAGLRDLLDRIGDPDEIVAAARDDDESGQGQPPPPPPPPAGTVPPWGYQPPVYRPPGIGLEIAAIGLMTVGSLIPFVGWTAGTIMLWFSHRLRIVEKLLMTLVFPGGSFVFLALTLFLPGQVCSSSSSTSSAAGDSVQGATVCTGFAFAPAVGIPLFIVSIIAPFIIGGLLLKKASERAKLEPPVAVFALQPGARARWGGLEIAAVLLLSVGSFVLPFVGPLAGLVCAWISPAWTTTEKWIATFITGLVLVAPVIAILVLRT
jgi:hypothetical protein